MRNQDLHLISQLFIHRIAANLKWKSQIIYYIHRDEEAKFLLNLLIIEGSPTLSKSNYQNFYFHQLYTIIKFHLIYICEIFPLLFSSTFICV